MSEALVKLRGVEANMTDHGMRWFITCEVFQMQVEKFFGDARGESDFHGGDMLYVSNEEFAKPDNHRLLGQVSDEEMLTELMRRRTDSIFDGQD